VKPVPIPAPVRTEFRIRTRGRKSLLNNHFYKSVRESASQPRAFRQTKPIRPSVSVTDHAPRSFYQTKPIRPAPNVTVRLGRATTLAYGSYGDLTTITYAGSGTPNVHFGYDSAGDITSVTDELGQSSSFTYDQAGRVLTSADPVELAAGKVTAYT
jgi:YD repeat-containing protein